MKKNLQFSVVCLFIYFCCATAHIGSRPPRFAVSRSHTIRQILYERLARLTDRYRNTQQHYRRTSMPLSGFEPEIPAIKRPQTYAL